MRVNFNMGLLHIVPRGVGEHYQCNSCGVFIGAMSDISYERSVYSVYIHFTKIINWVVDCAELIYCKNCNKFLGYRDDNGYYINVINII